MYLANWSSMMDWEGSCDERAGEIFGTLEDWAWPNAVVLEKDEDIISYREHIQKTIIQEYKDLEQELKPTIWHFNGWQQPTNDLHKRYGIYELLELEHIQDKAFKVPKPVAVIVIAEVIPWKAQQ